MASIHPIDVLSLVVILVGSLAYWAGSKGASSTPISGTTQNSKSNSVRDISVIVQNSGSNCVLFYGSQTGTAEDYACRLAKEAAQRFGLNTMIADLADYDFDNLHTLPADTVVVFVLATYGEGEPTDNAVDFHDFITDENISFQGCAVDQPLASLQYAAFGLGNSTYEHYNAIVRRVTKALSSLGAQRITELGEGDDGAGTVEEDFLTWKESLWPDLKRKMGLEEHRVCYEPAFRVTEEVDAIHTANVYLGELCESHLLGLRAPYSAYNPYVAPIVECREAFTAEDRNCVHVEVDLSGSGLQYQTGDHVAVWPTNPEMEVDRFLDVFGLRSKRNTVINIEAINMLRVPIPTPTTYDAAARYYLEICGQVSRQFIATLANFAPDEQIELALTKLGSDKEYFRQRVSARYLNLAQAIQSVSCEPLCVPLSLLLEGVNHVQPRYYSICSSSLIQSSKIAFTAVVGSIPVDGNTRQFKGVTTNYLLALKRRIHGEPESAGSKYNVDGPCGKYANTHIPIHLRASNFKLPADSTDPIIMIGPGSGVAPFRAFIQERVALAGQGQKIGPSILFYGCRNHTKDFLYQEDWKEFEQKLQGAFQLITAFSREGPQKVYVQHRLEENGALVDALLQRQAMLYVCGDAARMARDVHSTLVKIIRTQRGISLESAEAFVKTMKTQGRYLEDVWS